MSHGASDEKCIFCSIIRKETEARIVYEDEDLIAFHDLFPAAPVHILVVPKRHIVNLMHVTEADGPLMGKMMTKCNEIAMQAGCTPGDDSGGFRILINNGAGSGQEIFHLHMHILGGPKPWGQKPSKRAQSAAKAK